MTQNSMINENEKKNILYLSHNSNYKNSSVVVVGWWHNFSPNVKNKCEQQQTMEETLWYILSFTQHGWFYVERHEAPDLFALDVNVMSL